MRDEMAEEAKSGEGEPGTKEAEAFVDALNHSAERVQTLWFSFLTFMLYLAVATGMTTHRMLFLESPLNLPVLNIPLPLLYFYILTPVIFVVFHFYMLLNLVLLARTARSFEDALVRALPYYKVRETFRMRIENTLFVQQLVGAKREREGFNGKLLSLMALITLALAPVAVMLYLQIKFLPYHSEWITWWHRGWLAVDLALVWTLWPGYRSRWGDHLRPKRSWRLVVPGVLSTVALAYAVMVATFPDERMYFVTDWLHGSTYLDPDTREMSSSDKPNWYALIAPVNTLALRGEDLIDDSKLKQIIEKNEGSADAHRWVATLLLAGRDLTGADLSWADVRHVDFSHTILNHAELRYVWAKEANFGFAQLQGASLGFAQLQGASLDYAQLQGAWLQGAQLRGASLWGAQLQGASLNYAWLQGASLDQARLQGASLLQAQLQGASLRQAQLQGAGLDQAQLQGAELDQAQLQGASLGGAQLQGASLNYAQLPGASLDLAQLQGASLDYARLQGASLDHAQLQGASFVACVWRADARQAVWKDTRVELPKEDKIHKCDWTAAFFEALKQLIAAEVPEGENKRAAKLRIHIIGKEVPEGDEKRAAMRRIKQRLDPAKALEGENEMAKIWADHDRSSPAPEAYDKSLAVQWRELGCAADGAPYVLHALIARLLIARLGVPHISPFRDQSDAAKSLASAFLDEVQCPGAHGLSEADKVELKKIAAPAAPQAPKP